MYNRTTCMQVAINAIYMAKEDALNRILVFTPTNMQVL